MKESIDLLEKKSGDSEQYSRRNCLLVHGVEKQGQENADNVVLNVINEHLDIELLIKDLDRSQRIGKSNSKNKRRPIIVTFISYGDCREIFNNKKRLKGTGVFITESLTTRRMLQLKMQGINLALIMCGQLVEESCVKEHQYKTRIIL